MTKEVIEVLKTVKFFMFNETGSRNAEKFLQNEALRHKSASYDRTNHLKIHPKRVKESYELKPLSPGIIYHIDAKK